MWWSEGSDEMREFYEFFAGGGMASLGLGEPWTCTFANDNDERKAASYRYRFGSDHFNPLDVGLLTTKDLPGQATLTWASFPCQDLSLAGNGKGLNGKRSGTFRPFWNLMKGLQREGRAPKLIVLENVCGAITSNNGRDFAEIAQAVAGMRYSFGAVVIDAVHFVPQSRPRLFVVMVAPDVDLPVGITRTDPGAIWHPRNLVEAKFKLSKDAQDRWIWWNLPAPPERTVMFSDLIEEQPSGVKWNSNEDTRALLDMMSLLNRAKVRTAQKDGALRVGTLYKRTRDGKCRAEVRFDDVAGCLRTPTGGSSRQTIIVVRGQSVRTRLLSPREAGRLMGLPEDYALPQSYNDAYRLAGDGLVVPVVSHLAKGILTPIADAIALQEGEMAA
jgi:DNA (cytosine-5)-methyltransferase 1